MIQYQTSKQAVTAVIAAQPRRRRSLVDCLAEAIREMGYAGDAMTYEAFEQRGYSRSIVDHFGPDAQAEARRRSVRRVDA